MSLRLKLNFVITCFCYVYSNNGNRLIMDGMKFNVFTTELANGFKIEADLN